MERAKTAQDGERNAKTFFENKKMVKGKPKCYPKKAEIA